MAASVADIARLRRMVAEPGVDTYLDTDLSAVIERYPLVDVEGREPTHIDWVATYDLHNAASELWSDKAALLVTEFDFSADGANYSRSQAYAQAMKMVAHHNSRRASVGHVLRTTFEEDPVWPTA